MTTTEKIFNNAWLSPSGKWVIDHPEFDVFGAWHEGLGQCILLDRWKDNKVGIPINDSLDVFEVIQGRWDSEKDQVTEGEVLKLEPTLQNSFFDGSTEILEGLGWIRLHGFGGIPARFLLTGKENKNQKKAIIDWQLANERSWESSTERV